MGTDWLSANWKSILEDNSLSDFDSVWRMSLERVDEPNKGRGGWSEVCRYPLNKDSGTTKTLYIKRQENYTGRSWHKLFKSLPTFEREYNNLIWCQQHNIPVVEPIAFMTQSHKRRAILITAGLDAYVPLSVLEQQTSFTAEIRDSVIARIADQVANMHGQRFRHGCLYSKHIYISQSFLDTGEGDIRLIDMEKGRPFLFRRFDAFRDLDSLNRHAVGWSQKERSDFLKRYLGEDISQFDQIYHRLDAAYHNWVAADA